MKPLPSDLSEKINTPLQTISNNADPKMEISVARAKNTVTDVDPWTVETIRQKEGLGDISVAARRFVPYGRPNRLYEIHVDTGIVKTALREYPDKLKNGWQDQFILGPGLSVGMAFNGHWQRYRKLWRLITDEKPWIFWVDDANILWRQHWDDENTKFELDTDVIDVKAIRGWKNINFADKDQGIVVGYIKTDGTVWYRNYCDRIGDTPIWENKKQLTGFSEIATNLNLFITNDYRVGFTIEDTLEQIHWLITPRNWAGMAIESDYIIGKAKGKVEMVYITKIKSYITEYISAGSTGKIEMFWGSPINSFLTAENLSILYQYEDTPEALENWGFRIKITTAHKLINLHPYGLKLKDSTNMEFVISGIYEIENKVYILECKDFNNAIGELTLLFESGGTIRGECGQVLSPFAITFTPINLSPRYIPLPEVESIWNE